MLARTRAEFPELGKTARRPRASRLVLSACAVLASGGALTACSATPVKASPAAHADTPQCQKASTHWPATVNDKSSYPVSTASKAVHAWGDSADAAVIARCGVDTPGPTTDACIGVDNIDWVQSAVPGGYRFVTYGRQPAVEVLVPKAASKTPGMLLPAFTSAANAIPQDSHHCE